MPATGLRLHRRKSRLPLFLALALLVVLGVVGYGVMVGWSLTHPARRPITSNPGLWGMPYRTIRFPSQNGHLNLHGWWLPAPKSSRLTVVFAHGYGMNRAESDVPGLAVAHALHLMGANILMFDFRAEGRSPGTLVSVGVYEQRDLRGAVHAVLTRFAPGNRIVLLGYSMGAATAILTGSKDPHVAGVIADSPFSNLSHYLQDHLPVWTHLPAFPFNSIILGILPVLTGVNMNAADPLAVIHGMGQRPILLIAGLADTAIPARNSITLYDAVKKGDPQAALWLVPHASHVGAFRVDPVGYLQHLYRFLHGIDPQITAPPRSFGF